MSGITYHISNCGFEYSFLDTGFHTMMVTCININNSSVIFSDCMSIERARKLYQEILDDLELENERS